jgi:hypothetical protein
MVKTKAQLEDEITYLKERVAALEGACTAYRFALEQANGNYPQPIQPYQPFEQWPGLGYQPNILPCTTPQPFPYVTYTNTNTNDHTLRA